MPEALSIRPAVAADLGFVMATERLDGYDELVGRWTEDQHRAALVDGRNAYFIAETAGEREGFAILRDWASPDRTTLVKRLAVAHPGQGFGTALTSLVIDAAFTLTDVHRLSIGTFPENLRARRAYARAGFIAEGVARDGVFFGGRFRDELILSILRPEWAARRAPTDL